MEKINNISFEDWVCANELLNKGLHPQKIFDVLEVNKATWLETDKKWHKKLDEIIESGDREGFFLKKYDIEKNPMSYHFTHITEEEITADLEANGGIRYFIEDDLPKSGLTLAFLKEQDDDEWIDFISRNIDTKINELHDMKDILKTINKDEYLFYSVISWEETMSWGFNDFYDFYDWLVDDLEKHLEIIGAKKHLKIVQKANKLWKKIQEMDTDFNFDELDDGDLLPSNDLRIELEELNDEYYNLEDTKPLKDILLKYVKKNVKAFVN